MSFDIFNKKLTLTLLVSVPCSDLSWNRQLLKSKALYSHSELEQEMDFSKHLLVSFNSYLLEWTMPIICCGSVVQNNETPGFYLHLEQIYSKKKSHKHPCSVLQSDTWTDRMYPFFSSDLFFSLIIKSCWIKYNKWLNNVDRNLQCEPNLKKQWDS